MTLPIIAIKNPKANFQEKKNQRKSHVVKREVLYCHYNNAVADFLLIWLEPLPIS